MRRPMCSVSIILDYIYGFFCSQTVTTQYSVCCILFVVFVFLFHPIPSVRLIYHSFLHTAMTVNMKMSVKWNHIPHQEMTKYRNDVRSLNTSGEGVNTQHYLRTTTTASTRTAKTCCPSASVRDDEN